MPTVLTLCVTRCRGGVPKDVGKDGQETSATKVSLACIH